MKYPVTLLAFLGLALATASAQNLLTPLLIDSTHWRYYESATGLQQNLSVQYKYYNSENLETHTLSLSTWTGQSTTYFRDTSVYDSNKNQVRWTSYQSTVSADGPWEYSSKDSLAYDNQGRLIRQYGEYGNAGNWVPYYDVNYGFDDANHRDSLLYLLWDPSSLVWENYSREFTQRTADDKILEYRRDNWDATSESWKPARIEYYTYQPDGKLLVARVNEFSSNNVETMTVDSSIYQPDGKLDSTFFFNHIADYNIHNLFVTKYKYDSEGQLESSTTVRSSDGGLTFSNNSRKFYEPADGVYSDEYSYELVEIAQNGTYYPNWEERRIFTPLGNGRVLYSDAYLLATPLGNPLLPNTIDSVWYRAPAAVGVAAPTQTPACYCTMANPFHQGNTISCQTSNADALIQYRITDLNGQPIASGQAQPGAPWHPVIHAQNGVYLLNVWQNGVFLGSRKLVWMN